MKIYRHPADRLPSLVVLAIFTIQMATLLLADSLWVVAGVTLALFLCSATPGSINHSHHHTPTFRYAWMNRVYEVVLFLQTGVPPYAWTLHHNLGHHRHYLDPQQDTSAWKHPDGRVMSRVYYDIVNALRIYPEIFRIGRRHPELLRRFKVWGLVSLAVLALLIAINPLAALVLFVLPVPFMYIGLLDNTYMQHSDLDTHSDLTASRNTSNRLYNLVSLNLGYHSAHHMRPHVHWSELPELHERIKAQIPAGVQCDSVLLSACTYRHSRDGEPPRDTLPVDAGRELAAILPAAPRLPRGAAARPTVPAA